MTMVKVQAGQSILEGYIRTPLRGLTELIWNARSVLSPVWEIAGNLCLAPKAQVGCV